MEPAERCELADRLGRNSKRLHRGTRPAEELCRSRGIAPKAARWRVGVVVALLGQDLDFVRVDLYDVGGRVLVGELTPYPTGGNCYYPAGTDTWLGRAWRTKPLHVVPLIRGTRT